ncbi:MAG: 4-hydroxythreonine-4-phosphate dehydrogenase PdxA [Phycisphaerales bacterium]|nr:4-hydroxythreonine-4-phosphate dehydrogenase PdxA [Phycisphaerales bacterium]
MPSPVPLAISMGDPLGIGPEVVARALDGHAWASPIVVFGMEWALRRAAAQADVRPFWRSLLRSQLLAGTGGAAPEAGEVVLVDDDRFEPGHPDFAPRGKPRPTRAGGEASFQHVLDAIELCNRRRGDPWRAAGIVTAPIAKASWELAGHAGGEGGGRGEGRAPGHTELLAERFESPRSAMLFVGPRLRVILVTIHVPLGEVPGLVTIERVLRAIELGHEACVSLGVPSPRIAVCGLNPHAGEGGLMGIEDEREIRPAIEAATRNGIRASGPWPADTIFKAAAAGEHDLIVAMYHDQGLIPVKLVDGFNTVNVTVGLPVVRTSPAHGTAFNIAGRGVADPASMVAAIELAESMCRQKSV